MGPLGNAEIVILIFLLAAVVVVPVLFIHRYGKEKGRLKELEKQIREKDPTR